MKKSTQLVIGSTALTLTGAAALALLRSRRAVPPEEPRLEPLPEAIPALSGGEKLTGPDADSHERLTLAAYGARGVYGVRKG